MPGIESGSLSCTYHIIVLSILLSTCLTDKPDRQAVASMLVPPAPLVQQSGGLWIDPALLSMGSTSVDDMQWSNIQHQPSGQGYGGPSNPSNIPETTNQVWDLGLGALPDLSDPTGVFPNPAGGIPWCNFIFDKGFELPNGVSPPPGTVWSPVLGMFVPAPNSDLQLHPSHPSCNDGMSSVVPGNQPQQPQQEINLSVLTPPKSQPRPQFRPLLPRDENAPARPESSSPPPPPPITSSPSHGLVTPTPAPRNLRTLLPQEPQQPVEPQQPEQSQQTPQLQQTQLPQQPLQPLLPSQLQPQQSVAPMTPEGGQEPGNALIVSPYQAWLSRQSSYQTGTTGGLSRPSYDYENLFTPNSPEDRTNNDRKR